MCANLTAIANDTCISSIPLNTGRSHELYVLKSSLNSKPPLAMHVDG
jgi:hypothetical protein